MTDKKQRSVADLELATMRQCRRLIERLPPHACRRTVAYLADTFSNPDEKAPADPRQNELGF